MSIGLLHSFAIDEVDHSLVSSEGHHIVGSTQDSFVILVKTLEHFTHDLSLRVQKKVLGFLAGEAKSVTITSVKGLVFRHFLLVCLGSRLASGFALVGGDKSELFLDFSCGLFSSGLLKECNAWSYFDGLP
jgi:hypothetical protein